MSMNKIDTRLLFNQILTVFKLDSEKAFNLISSSGPIITSYQIRSLTSSLNDKVASTDERLSLLSCTYLLNGILLLSQFSTYDKQEWSDNQLINLLCTALNLDQESYLAHVNKIIQDSINNSNKHAIHGLLELF
jgi:hypothetical protein